MGGRRRARSALAAVNRDVARDYDAAAVGWASGTARVYAALATAVAEHTPGLSGRRVLDIGAGTGVLGAALLNRGAAAVVAVDLAPGMLARSDGRIVGVVGDATELPFADHSFDLAATAFCFSHLVDPAAAMREARRTSGSLLSASFDDRWTHPAKAAADEVLAAAGYRPPDWYVELKTSAPVDNEAALRRFAGQAGFATADVDLVEVATGVGGAAELADWRLGMAQVAGFLASLDPGRRRRLRHDVETALAGMPPLVVPVLVLSAS